jgi:hypothetical protein
VTTSNDIPILARPAFFSGQQLRAADLDAVTAYHRELSWLHNRSLHNWGIATGYSVTGAVGESRVVVSPGYALDCQGRELILTEARELPVPAVAGDAEGNPASYFLTASWLDDADLDAEIRTGLCGTSGAVRRPETADLRWQDPDDRLSGSGFRPGLDVVLASVQVQRCRLAADVSAAERRNAMPEEIPYVFSGQTAAGSTGWRLWPDDTDPIGVVTTVSTAAGGFGATPRYQAHVVGTRVFTDGIEGARTVVVDGYAHVAGAGAAGFELRVVLPVDGVTGRDDVAAVVNPADVVHAAAFPGRLTGELAWHVVWVGVEG